jgi:hypothetical protein
MKPHTQTGRNPVLWYQAALAVCIITIVALLYTDSAERSRAVIQAELQHSTEAAAGSHRPGITLRRAAADMEQKEQPQQQQQQQQQQHQHQQQPCTTETTYISSDFEAAWLGNVTTWQSSFCEVLATPQQQQWTKIWLDTLAQERSGQQDIQYDPAVFSALSPPAPALARSSSQSRSRPTLSP